MLKSIISFSCAGYQVGIFSKNTDFRSSLITGILCCLFFLNSMFGLGMTIFSRYTVIFPSKWSTLFKRKETYILIIIIHVIFNATTIVGLIPFINTTVGKVFTDAIEENPELQYFISEQTFFFIDYDYYKYGVLGSSFGIATLYMFFGIVIGVFVYQLQYNKKARHINDKLQRSLLISSVSQVSLTLVFLVTPFFCCLLSSALQIKGSALPMIILLSMVSTHCLLEFLTTMYFVAPYRKFLKEKVFRMKRKAAVVSIMSDNSHGTGRPRRGISPHEEVTVTGKDLARKSIHM